MSSGERPVGAAKGKQSDTEALCQPPLGCVCGCVWVGGCVGGCGGVGGWGCGSRTKNKSLCTSKRPPISGLFPELRFPPRHSVLMWGHWGGGGSAVAGQGPQ